MANKDIKQSQQGKDGFVIGNQGNEDITVPETSNRDNGNNRSQGERHIPNQEQSSASNQQNNQQKRNDQDA